MADDVVRAHIHVSGRVQGVYYRATATQEARRLGLQGWVRNLADGRVEAVAEGARGDVEDFIRWCHDGPTHARVDDVQTAWEAPKGEDEAFALRR